jgi:hypothetical protein
MTPNKRAEAANITTFDIFSNYGKTFPVLGGVTELHYYESVLDHTVRASVVMVDSGIKVDEDGVSAGVENNEGLKLTAGEKVHLVMEDNYGQKLSFVGDYHLRVKEVKNILENSKFMSYTLDLYSKECIDNELLETRVTKRYDLKITDSVTAIMKADCIKTPKNVQVDPGLNDYNFLGHVQKPFYVITTLAKKCVPEFGGADGTLAGYLFYETGDTGRGTTGGFKFKSIDVLFAQKPIRKLIYNDTTGLPLEYDAKILSYSFDNTVDLERQMKTGGMFQTQLRTFDMYKKEYLEEPPFDASAQFKIDNNGGIEAFKLGEDLGIQSKVTRFDYSWKDIGVLPLGGSLSEQLGKSKEMNFEIDKILRQSYSRYNNLFTTKLTVTIAGDFGLHAGDLVHCDFPEVSDKANQVISERKSGIYMIVDICHFLRSKPGQTYTKMNLVRDTLGRKPF